MTLTKIKVQGIRKEPDRDQLALVYWLLAKHRVEERRRREAEEKRDRQSQGGRS
jgi:hypothetical protein